MKSIYVVLMHTGTIPSRGVSIFTRYKYSHVVLSLDTSLTKLYSFGRRTIRNMFNAGLVTYGIESDFFKKFHKTECVIFKVPVSKSEYNKLIKILDEYEEHINVYHYDIKGLIMRIFYSDPKVRENYYVCSQFVSDVLIKSGIYDFGKKPSEVRPIDFTKIKKAEKIYEGKLLKFNE